MKSVIAKMGAIRHKARGERATETFYADVSFRTDVTSIEQRLRLLVADGVDGWLAAVVYPDTKESITLAQYPGEEEAKAHRERWARTVHKITETIEWIPGLTPGDELKDN